MHVLLYKDNCYLTRFPPFPTTPGAAIIMGFSRIIFNPLLTFRSASMSLSCAYIEPHRFLAIKTKIREHKLKLHEILVTDHTEDHQINTSF